MQGDDPTPIIDVNDCFDVDGDDDVELVQALDTSVYSASIRSESVVAGTVGPWRSPMTFFWKVTTTPFRAEILNCRH